jgi:hypothetical protein
MFAFAVGVTVYACRTLIDEASPAKKDVPRYIAEFQHVERCNVECSFAEFQHVECCNVERSFAEFQHVERCNVEIQHLFK